MSKIKPMSENQRKYLEEYEKLKNIKIEPGQYILNDTATIVRVKEILENEERAVILNEKSRHMFTKTLHWCRKHLTKV